MGELLKQIRHDNMQAMKEKDEVRKGVCSLLISAIALAEKESGKVLEKDEELVFVQKELKQTKEELESIPDSRPELKEKAQQKIAIIESYLPKQMSDDEIRDALEKIIAEKGLDHTKKSQGQVMKAMMAEYKGKTDGKTVARVLGTLLH
ncbi:MAG: GatB/YqeY domain-containing protein [Lactimicrobium massiliense]|nr:GatB/YqeY domain-containing protein [Lactimicrobium massiliense]MDD6559634.1 GatB/YqeY domain-containing protein [Lactimicrobium massiliense]